MLIRKSMYLIGIVLLLLCIILIMPMDHMHPIGSTMAGQPPPFEDGITYWDGDWDVDSDALHRNQTTIVNEYLKVLRGLKSMLEDLLK